MNRPGFKLTGERELIGGVARKAGRENLFNRGRLSETVQPERSQEGKNGDQLPARATRMIASGRHPHTNSSLINRPPLTSCTGRPVLVWSTWCGSMPILV